ncbi:MAG: hypothetical protein IKP75_04720 [Oscillospiraceae bacterium]|nr:hypothetical protein [Oscillospiraceae bacterium]
MHKSKKYGIADLLRRYIVSKNNQGYSVLQSGYMLDYNTLILRELTKLETLSDKYIEELRVLSKGIRRYLWYNCDARLLYYTLFQLNEIYKLLFERIESVELILDYITHLSTHFTVNDKTDIFEKMRDDVYLANAKVIITKKWESVLSSDDGSKSFLELFDDIFSNVIVHNENEFYVELTEQDILCRMVKEKDCDESRFIPWPNKAYNRWNPPGKTYLYLSYSKENYNFNDDLTINEYVCLLECRTKIGEDCCFVRFSPTRKGRILDLSYNDVTLQDYRKQLSDYEEEIEHSIFDVLVNDTEYIKRIKESRISDANKLIFDRVEQLYKKEYKTRDFLSLNLSKQILKMICQSIYTKVDEETDEGKEKAYKSFHLLSEYLESKGITGIIYPCTRTDRVIGKNIVLFSIDDAKPVYGSIKKYHCTLTDL